MFAPHLNSEITIKVIMINPHGEQFSLQLLLTEISEDFNIAVSLRNTARANSFTYKGLLGSIRARFKSLQVQIN